MNKIKSRLYVYIAGKIPFLGVLKRDLTAYFHSRRENKESYSQHGEDTYIYQLLKDKDLSKSIYIDIGANHPTKISNTYLLYRKGLYGLIIEPNIEYQKLFHKYRPRDIFLGVGCSNSDGFKKFVRYSIPVSNTFSENSSRTNLLSKGTKILSNDYLPIFKLDSIMRSIKLDYKWISLLSIDTEGLDLEVLKGASENLHKVLILCVEQSETDKGEKIKKYLTQNNFRFLRQFGCNLLFQNSNIFIPS